MTKSRKSPSKAFASLATIFDFLKAWAPLEMAEDWDNVGIQIGNSQSRIHRTLVSLDVTIQTLQEARDKKCELLITHHPLFFKPILNLEESQRSAQLASFALRHEINVLSFHTNLDSTQEGLNDLLSRQIGLRQVKAFLKKSGTPPSAPWGLGRIGTISPQTLMEFSERILKTLKLSHSRYVGNPQKKIKKIAVITGSGASLWRQAQAAGADLLVTGDVKYHDALEAEEAGFAILDIGHFGSEIGMVKLVSNKLRAWAKMKKLNLEIFETTAQQDPIQLLIESKERR